MTGNRSIRWPMLVLFCVTAGLLLGVSYTGLYVVFQRVVRGHFDRRITEIAAPIIADISVDPDDKDVDLLNITDEYFEVLDSSGTVLQRSRNLHENLPVSLSVGFQTIRISGIGEIRGGLIFFTAGEN